MGRSERLRLTAKAVWNGGRWCVSLVGSPDISVTVPRLTLVDAAMSRVLERVLGHEQIDAVVHIRWYDASYGSNPANPSRVSGS
jgi:hypothetical protein